MNSLKDRTVNGIAWSVAERFSVQGIQFFIMIIIARILSPSDYGLIGMLAIFIMVSDILIASGFSQALIRKQDRTEIDNSTVFYFNIVVSLALYAILYCIAPWVSSFYNEPQLCSVMRAMCLIIVIFSFGVVQRAILTAKIDFKTQTKASLTASLMSGLLGIYLAYSGYGVWTLVWQQLTNAGLSTALLWRFSSWRPKLIFSWFSFQGLFSFGSKLMLVGLIDTVYNNLFQLIIGKVYSAANLGFYSRARHFAEFPSQNITMVLQRVTYPVLCTIQDEDGRLAVSYRKMLKLSAFVMFPLMVGLAAISGPFVDLILGVKWHFVSILLTPVCLSMMWYPINSINLSLLQVKGRPDLFLRIEIIKKMQGIILLFASFPYGVVAMCYAMVLSTLISVYINTIYTGILINVGFVRQMKDLLPTIIVCVIMYVAVHCYLLFFGSSWSCLIISALLGGLVYLSLVYHFKFSELHEIMTIIENSKSK